MHLAALSNGQLTDLTKFAYRSLARAFAAIVLLTAAAIAALAQSTAPKITQIDITGLRRLVRPQGKPLLINFWATWCVPCREEYPDLVKIDQEYRGKIDFVTVSLDDLADKDTLVPQFLAEMKAQMPPYLLITDNEEAAMAVVSKEWTGGLPFTILFDAKGGIAYSRQGKVKIDILKTALAKTAPAGPAATRTNR
jgi:thiol-disulfide isomerase/thioredoxin